jgi:DNA repair protein RecO (recombination protein O)
MPTERPAQDHRPPRSYRAHAVVLRTYKLGEADRIAVLLTEHDGKVRAVAKGARKSGSRFGALLEPTSHIDVQLYRGRGDLDTVTQVQAIDTFAAIRGDLDRFTRASSFIEATDHVTPDREPHERLYRMLVGALRLVAGDNPTLTAAGFFLKLLALEGLEPVLDRCIGCGATELLVAYDPVNSGARCANCRQGIPVSDEGLRICRLILSGGLAAALKLPDDPVLDELNRLTATMVEHQTDRRLKSLSVI